MAMDIKSDNKDFGLDMPANLTKSADNKPEAEDKKKGKKGLKVAITLIIIIVVLALAGFLLDKYTSLNLLGTGESKPEAPLVYNIDNFYAVFLSNGQVYFGKVAETTDEFTLLENIYYLQVSNALQQVPPAETEQQPQLTLVKLGNELHGPEDYMKINNSHIVFVEALKNNGKVVEAINQYVANNPQ